MRKGMSYSEAGRLGALKVRCIVSHKHELAIEKYYENPNLCIKCHRVIPYEKRRNDFCSQSCSAIFNNTHKEKKRCVVCGKTGVNTWVHKNYCSRTCERKDKISESIELNRKCKCIKDRAPMNVGVKCVVCGNVTSSKRNKFCSHDCFQLYQKMKTFKAIEKAGKFPASKSKDCPGEASRTLVRSYLEFNYGHKCALCGIDKWNGKPITLVVDHIDGNALNSKIDNFRLICPNCDSQLPTYKGRNKGHGRKCRRQQAVADAR